MSEGSRLEDADASARDFEEWARFMRLKPDQLREAVHAVGISPRSIRRYLRETVAQHEPQRSAGPR